MTDGAVDTLGRVSPCSHRKAEAARPTPRSGRQPARIDPAGLVSPATRRRPGLVVLHLHADAVDRLARGVEHQPRVLQGHVHDRAALPGPAAAASHRDGTASACRPAPWSARRCARAGRGGGMASRIPGSGPQGSCVPGPSTPSVRCRLPGGAWARPMVNPVHTPSLPGIAEACDAKRASLVLMPATPDGGGIRMAPVDGFIAGRVEHPGLLHPARQRRLPQVTVDIDPGPEFNAVWADAGAGGDTAARHLLDLGHRRFGVLSVLRCEGPARLHPPGPGRSPDIAGMPSDTEKLHRHVRAGACRDRHRQRSGPAGRARRSARRRPDPRCRPPGPRRSCPCR